MSLQSFIRSRAGSMSAIVGLSFPLLLAAIGAAVDFSRTSQAKTELTRAVESAVLAAASLSSTRNTADVVNEYVTTNINNPEKYRGDPVIQITETTALNAKSIQVTVTASVETVFLKLLAIDELDIEVSASAGESRQNVELSLVVDISSSMRGAKLRNLTAAASDFVDALLADERARTTSISLVPFGGTVNIGPGPFEDFAVAVSDATLDPTAAAYSIGSDLLKGAFRFSNGYHCLEHPGEDFESDSLFAKNSKSQVPHFWKWYDFQPWCPHSSSAALFNSNDVNALKQAVQGLSLSDGTGMDIGALWGYKALSEHWTGVFGGDFPDRPLAYGDDVVKVMVIMTDGAITSQMRPLDPSIDNLHTNRTSINPPGETGRHRSGNSDNQQTVIRRGSATSSLTFERATSQLREICKGAKENGILIYTIGFQIASGSLPDALLKECATNLSMYFFVEGLNINDAFDSIAASVNALRITG